MALVRPRPAPASTTSELGSYAQSPGAEKLRGAYGSGRYSERKSSTRMVLSRRPVGSVLRPGTAGKVPPLASCIGMLRQPDEVSSGSEAILR